MSVLPDYKFIYVLAAGRGLEMIKDLENNKEALLDDIKKTLPNVITLEQAWDDETGNYISFSLKGDAVPDGWSGGNIWPDIENDAVRTPFAKFMNSEPLTMQFNKMCQKYAGGNTHELAPYYSYEKLGDSYVIKCPESSNINKFFVPPDSVVISHDEYRKMKIKARQEPAILVVPFSM